MSKMKIASTQFDLKAVSTPNEFWERVEKLARIAADAGAQVLQFPEYFSLSWLLARHGRTFSSALDGFTGAVAEEFHRKFKELTQRHQMVILAGTVPVIHEGRRVNRAFTYLPKGERIFQDKYNMTRFENEEWSVAAGVKEVSSFEWQGVKFGVAICYDVEFPEYVRTLVKKDIDVILVPSCTDDVHGYWRVRHCAEARAVESQSYVIMSSIVGGDLKHPEIGSHYGAAGFFTPCDVGFPEGGMLGSGTLNKEDVHVFELDFEKLKKIRVNGTVLNRRDQN
jgi:predicted amidohydrolase